MNRPARAIALSAAASALMLGSSFASDFIETIAAQAPLAKPDAAADCQKAAEIQLSEPMSALKKRCDEGGGRFNVGIVTPSIHRKSCSVYQTVTCSGTDGPQEANVEPTAPPAEKPKPEPKKRSRRKPRTGERQVQAAAQDLKGK